MKYYLPVIKQGESLADALDALESSQGSSAHPPGPTRASCEDRTEERTRGREWCVALNCRHNLLREALKKESDDEAAEHFALFLDGTLVDTCVLDFASNGPMTDEETALALGVSEQRGKQMVQEAMRSIRLSKAVLKVARSKKDLEALAGFRDNHQRMLANQERMKRFKHAARLIESAKSSGQATLFDENNS